MSGSRGKRKRSQGRAASSSGTPMAAEGTLVEEASGRRRRTTRRPPTGAEAEHAASLQVRSHSLRRRMQGRRLHLVDVGVPVVRVRQAQADLRREQARRSRRHVVGGVPLCCMQPLGALPLVRRHLYRQHRYHQCKLVGTAPFLAKLMQGPPHLLPRPSQLTRSFSSAAIVASTNRWQHRPGRWVQPWLVRLRHPFPQRYRSGW